MSNLEALKKELVETVKAGYGRMMSNQTTMKLASAHNAGMVGRVEIVSRAHALPMIEQIRRRKRGLRYGKDKAMRKRR